MILATIVQTVLDLLWKLIVPALSVFAGWYWGQWQAGNAWQKKEFRTVLLLGLNHIEILDPADSEEGHVAFLQLRTLFERKIESVFPNSAMRDLVKQGIDKTSETDPIVRVPAEEGWFILNRVLNEIGEQFAVGTLKRNMGLPVESRRYIFCLTFERDGKMHQFKPRVLIQEKEAFLNFPEEGPIKLESPNHTIRVRTIRQMKAEYKRNPQLFMEMEICL